MEKFIYQVQLICCCQIFIYLLIAAAAKSLQSCPTLCDPTDGSPPGSPVPGILQARTLEWVAISFSNAWKWKVKVKLLSRVWLQPPRFLRPWDFPGKSTGVGCHCLLRFKYYLAIKENKTMTFAATWIDLEILILSEVSHKEKNKCKKAKLLSEQAL